MKIFSLVILLFHSLCLFAAVPEINEVRLKFHNATSSEKACKDLISQLEPYNETNNPLLMGYKAGATMIMAKHVVNPFTKLSYFKKGKSMLEKAISVDAKNIELRFLRYTIQTNVPSFLGYKTNVSSDHLFLTRSVNSLKDSQLKKIINAYLKQHKPLSND
jgi:hypothetical protein